MSPSQQPGQPYTARQILQLGSDHLSKAGVDQARLEMSLMLAHALGIDRLGLYVDLDRPLSAAELAEAREMLARRTRHEPLAYITGHKEFFELDLEVNRSTLIPRPETEHLVEAALEWLAASETERPEPLLADIGTGSGAIAIAGAVHCPRSRWIATDISPEALATARRNAERHGVTERIDFRLGSLLEPITEPLDAILSNPPYVPEGDREAMQPDVAEWEPADALFSGPDGLDCIRLLVANAPGHLRPGDLLAIECGIGQSDAILALMAATGAFETCRAHEDLAGIPRVITALCKI